MTNKEAKEQIVKLWEKALADIKETMLYYHDWGLIELKAQHKEEAYKEIIEYLERKLSEVMGE